MLRTRQVAERSVRRARPCPASVFSEETDREATSWGGSPTVTQNDLEEEGRRPGASRSYRRVDLLLLNMFSGLERSGKILSQFHGLHFRASYLDQRVSVFGLYEVLRY